MRTVVRRLLGAVRLAPLGDVVRADADARHASGRAKGLEERLAATCTQIEEWKRRYEERSAQVTQWKQTATAAQAQSQADTDRLKSRAEDLKSKVAALTAQLEKLHGRIDGADRVASAARDELMLMETKLDLLEAAIQVLDARTREGAVS